MNPLKAGSKRGGIRAGFGALLVLAGVAMTTVGLVGPTQNRVSAQEMICGPDSTGNWDEKTEVNAQTDTSVTFDEPVIGACIKTGNGEELISLPGSTDCWNVTLSEDGMTLHFDMVGQQGCGLSNVQVWFGVAATATQPATATQAVVSTSTPTATQPVATSTQGVEATSAATSTSVPPTNTPTAIATSTQSAEATNTPEATNTAVPPTNTPTATTPALEVTAAIPPASVVESQAQQQQVLGVQATPPSQVLGVQATPPPTVRSLPSTGSGGGYEDNSMTFMLIGAALVLTGSAISLMAIKRRA